MENIMLCFFFAIHACRPLLQGFENEEELCMTEVTTTCGKSLWVEIRDGAGVQLMMRMREPGRRWAMLMFLTLGTLGRISAWTILYLRVMKRLKVERIRRERSTGMTIQRGMGYLRNVRMVDAICVFSHQG